MLNPLYILYSIAKIKKNKTYLMIKCRLILKKNPRQFYKKQKNKRMLILNLKIFFKNEFIVEGMDHYGFSNLSIKSYFES